MNRIKTYLESFGETSRAIVLALAVVFVSAGIAQAATTISTNIQTDGTLAVTGLSSLGSASSTQLSANTAYFGQTATSTFGSGGALTLAAGLTGTSGTFSTTLSVTGLSSLGSASSTQLSANTAYFGQTATSTFDSAGNIVAVGTLGVTGATTLASTTATGFQVGQVGTHMTRIVSGYCVTTSFAIPATNASSTQTYVNCTPSGGTSVISANDRVFVQATSSLPYWVVVQSASSTATGGLINVSLTNVSTSTAVAAAIYAFNFWAFQ